MLHARFRFVPIVLLSLIAQAAFAQPASVNRIVRMFDFEERKLGNVEDLPMQWLKVDGDGMPAYVNGSLTTDRARSGRYSFRFDLNGGSLVYRYPAGLIPVRRDAHYRVGAFVKTTASPNARARLTAYFTDLDGHALDKTVCHSKLFVTDASTINIWSPLELDLTADDERSAFLVIELEMLNPAQYSPADFGERTLFPQDIRATAWFDDVSISQVPLVTMSTDHVGNVLGHDDLLKLSVLLNDRFTDDLSAALVVRDRDGRLVYQKSGALDLAAATQLGPCKKRMSLTIDANLAPGWYRASLQMSSQGQFVGEQTLDFVRLSDDAKGLSPDPRFGIVATDLPRQRWPDLPGLLRLLGAGRVKLSVWNEEGDVQQTDPNGFDDLIEQLQSQRVVATACLTSIPPNVLAKIRAARATTAVPSMLSPENLARTAAMSNDASWIELVKAPLDTWQPQLAYMISRHANHLDRWQIGDDSADDFSTNRAYREVYHTIYQQFAALVQKPDLAMPWSSMYDLDPGSPAALSLHIKPEVLPDQVPLYLAEATRGAASNADRVSVLIDPISRKHYGRDIQIRDFAQRVCYALAADAKHIDFRLPFEVKRDLDAVSEQPDELLLVMRTMIGLLGNATFKGKVPIAEGVDAFLFDRDGRGVIMLWSRGNEAGVKQLALNVGKRPVCIDLFGNVSPLMASQTIAVKRSTTQPADALPMTLGPMPVFLVGINSQLAQLRASLCFDDDHIESNFKPHTRRLRFTNTFSSAIAGSVKLVAPKGWTINPPTQQFSLNPGEAFDREITIEFPYNSYAGAKQIDAAFHLQVEDEENFIVPMSLKLGLSDVGLQTMAFRDGGDVVVQQIVTNYGEKPIDYTSFAICPGTARQERIITALGAGRTIMKKYRFTGAAIVPGAKVRSGLRETVETRVLNDEVELR